MINPAPVTAWKPEYIPAYLSNGVVGVRAGPIPMAIGLCTVSGLASIQADEGVEGFARAPYPIGGDVVVNGYSLRELQPRCELLEQRYDLSCGELQTRLRFAGQRNEQAPLITRYAFRARPGEVYLLRQLTSLVPSALHGQPHRQASRLVVGGALLGFEELRRANRSAWAETWKGRPVLIGADRRWQALTDAAHYYLHASAHSSSLFSTSMFGLAHWPNYHYYRGQVMWDIEAFAYPPLALTDPLAGGALLDFRTKHLLAAEDNAALHGRRGLQFPGAASPLHGDEALRTDTTVVQVEDHVSLAVARAFAMHWHLTGDDEFLSERAWPVLGGVARWILSRAEATERGIEIKCTIGLAENRESACSRAATVATSSSAGAFRVYEDPDDLRNHLDELGIRIAR